jgi:hypothetical protein
MRRVSPVKLFIEIRESGADQTPHADERLIGHLTSEYGSVDHRMSLIPTDGTIHRVFLSFERLIEISGVAEIGQQARSIEEKFSVEIHMGFLDNRHAVVADTGSNFERSQSGESTLGESVIEFKNGGIHFFEATPPGYRSSECQEFFSAMRKTYRGQLRSMCLLRR